MHVLGFPAMLVHGDTLVLDRWIWLRHRLPRTRAGERVLDVGCGNGAFTIGAALRGYQALGLTWDRRDMERASQRALLCKARHALFEDCDVRMLGGRYEYREQFDVVICTENIEHILDDVALMKAMAACLKPGGRLLLTTPYLLACPLGRDDEGPFSAVEDGRHVRRGYSTQMLLELCEASGLRVEQIDWCSGITSQLLTRLMRRASVVSPVLSWILIAPMRWLPPLLDRALRRLVGGHGFSITLEACKPRLPTSPR